MTMEDKNKNVVFENDYILIDGFGDGFKRYGKLERIINHHEDGGNYCFCEISNGDVTKSIPLYVEPRDIELLPKSKKERERILFLLSLEQGPIPVIQ